MIAPLILKKILIEICFKIDHAIAESLGVFIPSLCFTVEFPYVENILRKSFQGAHRMNAKLFLYTCLCKLGYLKLG
jgi:hypothetical protein